MMNDSIMQEYTKYIDTSEMIIEYYKNQATAGLEKHFLAIEDWLSRDIDPEENRPLVIQAEEGFGKKTLLAQWMKYHQQKSQKTHPDVIVSHFAGTGGNNANYYYALYKILVRLRENLDISQKVELVEEKLTRYFYYWLDVASKALTAKIVNDSTIILVFDSINMFIEPETNEESNISLWLPATFPKGIRVIVTTEPGTSSYKRFEDLGCEIIKVEAEQVVPETMIRNHLNRPSYIVDEDYKTKVVDILQAKSGAAVRNYLFLKTYLSTLLPYPSDRVVKETDVDKSEFTKLIKNIDFKTLQDINDIDQLNNFLLDYFSKIIVDTEKFKKLMCALTLTEKGLTEQELFDVVKVSVKEWRYITAVFKTFFMTYKGFWKINNERFKKAIYALYLQKNGNYVKQLHEEIADALGKTSNSLRKLEEETYHLNRCRSYFKLKEAITNIENFLLLFNPNNKFELCRYWSILENRGFDPASEYTKSIEGFELHYRPNPEDTFMIILQISRFLKEFSDFETGATPDFRHPPIKGGKEMKEIGLRREIKKLGMYVSENWEDDDDKNDDLEELEHQLIKEFPDYSDELIKELTIQIYNSTQQKKQEDSQKDGSKTEPDSTQENSESPGKIKKKMGKKDPPILNPIEMLNVDIPENREKFRAHYLGERGKKKQDQNDGQNQQNNRKFLDEDDDVTASEQENGRTDNKIDSSGQKSKTNGLAQSNRDEIKDGLNSLENRLLAYTPDYTALSKGDIQPMFYYYKRWLWMMFPWVCMSYKMNYSKIIFECFSSATKYISVADEREKTRQALKIATEAKMKKRMILAKDGDNTTSQSSRIQNTTSPQKSKKALPPILEIKETNDRSSPISDNLSIGSSSSSPLKEIRAKVTTTKSQKLREHQFFITSEFLDVSNFSSNFSGSRSVTNHEVKSAGKDFSIGNISSINRDSNKSPITEKTLIASERKFEQTIQKSNQSLKTLLLPMYQDSVISYSDKQVEELDGKVQKLSLQLNDIVHQTKISAKKLKDLSVVEVNLKGTGVFELVERSKVRVVELEEQLTKAEKVKLEATKQKNRLESLIHICFKNKKEDELYIRSLNYLLTNFKKMISWERNATYEDLMKATELEKLSQQYMQVNDEKIQAYEVMIRHVKDEKHATKGVDKRVTIVYSNLEKSSQDAINKLRLAASRYEEKEQKEIVRQSILKDKIVAEREKLDDKREIIQQIQDKIGLNYSSPNFQGFMDYIEKLSEFERGIFETTNSISKLKEEQRIQTNYLETLKKAKSNQKTQIEASDSPSDASISKEELQNILKAKKKKAEELSSNIMNSTKLVLQSKLALNKMFGGIGIDLEKDSASYQKLPIEKLQAQLEEKFKIIEEKIGGEELQDLKKGKLDFNKYITLPEEKNKPLETIVKVQRNDDDEEQVNVFKQGKKFIEVGAKRS